MIRLLMIRHAKSNWAVPGQPDNARPLNERGRRDAPAIGAWLKARGLVPDLAIVSSAARTRETWSLVCSAMGEAPSRIEPDIYESAPDTILRVLRAAPAAAQLALVGHNPGIGEAARRLLAEPPADAAFRKYPTGAVAVIDFDAAAWAGIGWGAGRLADFVTPKTLPGDGAGRAAS